jgi:hypothetical protein
MRGRKLWSILLATAVAGVLVPLYALKPVDPVTQSAAFKKWGSAENIIKKIESCAVEHNSPLPPRQCYREMFLLAAEIDTLESLFWALRQMELENPYIVTECHIGAHAAGFILGENDDPVETLSMAVTETDACDQGFTHGILEGIGLQSVGMDVYRELGTVCTFMEDILRQDCVDGLGHSAWVNSRNPGRATEICMTIQSVGEQAVCIRGIVMAMNNPDLNEGKYSLDPNLRDEICGEVESVPGTEEIHVRSCYNGVALGLVNYAVWATQEAIAANPGLSPKELAGLTELWRKALSNCERWGDYGSSCHRSVLQQLNVQLPGKQEVCRDLSEPSPLRREDDCTGPLTAIEA